MADMKAAAIGRIFDTRMDSTRYYRQVGPIRLTLRASKNIPLSAILPVSSDDLPTETPPSGCCGTFPLNANSHWPRSRETWTLSGIFTRSSTLRLCHTLTITRCRTSHFLARWSHTAHCEYQGLAALRKLWKFWIGQAEILIWIWWKTFGASSNDNQTIPRPSSLMWRIYALRFTGCGLTSLENQPAT